MTDRLEIRSVYLAGPIDHCTYEETHVWRNEAEYRLSPMKCFNPARREFPATGLAQLQVKDVVALDKAEIEASDAVLAYYVPPAAGSRMTGTTMELIHAFENNKLVVVVSDLPLSAWVQYHSHRQFKTLAEGTDFIRKFYS